MRTFVIVEADVLGQSSVILLRAGVLVEIDFFVLDSAPETLGEDVVPGTPPAIHTPSGHFADLDLGSQQAVEILRAGKVAALITVPDMRHSL